MTLEEIRCEIDNVDTQMKVLFLKRMECARNVAQEKSRTGGDVYVPEREEEIIRKRTEDVKEVQSEYIEFLRYLMTVSRKYQYGFLSGMQDSVIEKALKVQKEKAVEENRVEITFRMDREKNNLYHFLNVLHLNGIRIEKLSLESEGETQTAVILLEGNLENSEMRRALCQIGKEAFDFSITVMSE